MKEFQKLKAFQCQYCEKGYTQSHSLKSHMLNVHKGAKFSSPKGQKVFQCQSCEKDFMFAKFLNKHIEKAHDGQKSPDDAFTFTAEQIDCLEAIFRNKKYINVYDIEKLAATGTYPEEKVQDWFAKRREEIGKVRKETINNC